MDDNSSGIRWTVRFAAFVFVAAINIGHSSAQSETGFGQDAIDGWTRIERRMPDDYQSTITVASTEHTRTKRTLERTRSDVAVFSGSSSYFDSRINSVQHRDVVNSDGCFSIFRDSANPTAPWLLQHQLNKAVPDGMPDEIDDDRMRDYLSQRFHHQSFSASLYQYQSKRLDQLIPARFVTRLPDNGTLVRYSFSTDASCEFPNERGEVLLDPEHDFRVVSLVNESWRDGKPYYKAEITNSGFSEDGLSFIATERTFVIDDPQYGPGVQPHGVREITVAIDSGVTVSAGEFDLTHYGIVLEPVKPKRNWGIYILIGGGAILLCAAAWYRLRN